MAIIGMHALICVKRAAQVRRFFQTVLKWPAVDAGHGWLIFAAPPAELAVHPSEGTPYHELYLLCDDLKGTIAELKRKGVRCSRPTEQRWGMVTSIRLPGGVTLGLYEPRHSLAIARSPAPTRPASRRRTIRR